jgi:hypothetical protein
MKNSENFSDLFKRRFLIEFTKGLIRNSVTEINVEQKNKIIEIPFKQNEVNVPFKQKRKVIEIPQMQKTSMPVFKGRKISRIPSALRIPEPILPPAFQYLHPYPTQKEIDLGKLNPLLKDNHVRVIECNGENESIVVEGTMGRKITQIALNKEEIDEIIRKFSEEGKIPIKEGIHRIVVGRLIFSAIVSEIVSTKFIIRKMMN